MLDTMRWRADQRQALDCGLPVVTAGIDDARPRSAGMLSLLGLPDSCHRCRRLRHIATQPCHDVAWRAALASIRECNGVSFDDPAPLGALEAFYREAVSAPV
jgi:hypothetical protein